MTSENTYLAVLFTHHRHLLVSSKAPTLVSPYAGNEQVAVMLIPYKSVVQTVYLARSYDLI